MSKSKQTKKTIKLHKSWSRSMIVIMDKLSGIGARGRDLSKNPYTDDEIRNMTTEYNHIRAKFAA